MAVSMPVKPLGFTYLASPLYPHPSISKFQSFSPSLINTCKVSSFSTTPSSREHPVMAKKYGRESSSASPKLQIICQKRAHGRSRDDTSTSDVDGSKGDDAMSRRTTYQSLSLGLPKLDKKNLSHDLKDGQVIDGDGLQAASFLNAVVKVYCTHSEHDYSLPWQKQRQYTSTGSAFMIGGRRLLTNAHCVEHHTQVKVKRRGDDTKFVAKVLAKGVECDIALLSVESEEFWKGTEPLRFGCLPCLQDAVTVVGYPLGGDTISVTKGIVSRIEVTSYAHGATDLLGIQIDAAVNPGNSGGPAFNENGECIGVAFQVYRSDDAENIGYVIPTTVVSHFLNDYDRNGKYTGFPCLGVLLQKLENPALRECLNITSNEGVLIRTVEPTSPANEVLKAGDVIVSFDGVAVANEGTVPFRFSERIALGYLISEKYTGDKAEIGIIREGRKMNIITTLNPRVHLVPYHIEEARPSYLIVAGLVFTPLSEPLIDNESEDTIGLRLLAKARYCLPQFEGEQIVILSQILANEVNLGYENMSNQQVLKFNGVKVKNVQHLAHLVDLCNDKYLIFEFEDKLLVVLERQAASLKTPQILQDYGIAYERSPDLREPYVLPAENTLAENEDLGCSPIFNSQIDFSGMLWA